MQRLRDKNQRRGRDLAIQYLDTYQTEKTSCVSNDILLHRLQSRMNENLRVRHQIGWTMYDHALQGDQLSIVGMARTVQRGLMAPRGVVRGAVLSGDNGYALDISISLESGAKTTHREYFSSFADLEERGPLLLMMFLDPLTYAVQHFEWNPQRVENSLNLMKLDPSAFEITAELIDLISGYNFLYRQKHSENTLNALLARQYFEEAVAKSNDDPLLVAGLTLSYLRASTSLASLENDQISRLLEDLDRLASSVDEPRFEHALIGMIQGLRSEKESADQAWKIVAENLPGVEFHSWEEEDKNIFTILLVFYIENKRFVEASQIWRRAFGFGLEDKTEDSFLALDWRYLFVRAIYALSQGELELAERLMSINALLGVGSGCAHYNWGQILWRKAREATEADQRLKLLQKAHVAFRVAERQGVRSFSFYNQWGNLLGDLNQRALAAKKFTEATSYYGDHRWALLNAGNVLFAANDFHGAEHKYRESLESGSTEAAIGGLLKSIFKQKEHESFIEEYFVWQGNIMKKTELDILLVLSYCEVGHQEEAKNIAERLTGREDVDPATMEAINMCLVAE